MKNILHIVPDDKFIDVAIMLMDTVTNVSNMYVCPVDEEHVEQQGFRFITLKERVSLFSISKLNQLLDEVPVDIVAFHTLPFCFYEYVLRIPKSIKIWWLIWGYDIYTNTSDYDIPPIIPLQLYKPQTKNYIKSRFSPTLTTGIKRTAKILMNYNGNRDRANKIKKETSVAKLMRQSVLERIDYVSTVLPIEYEMLSKIKRFNAEYIPFQYPFKPQDSTFHRLPQASYILVGNSSDSTNNHLDVIQLIRKRSIDNVLYLPLAYGDAGYKKYLIAQTAGQKNILIQDDFISREEYISILSNCKAAVFGHIRQQALGNIVIMMMLGLKVFLYKDSICYKYFKANGYLVFSVEKDLNKESIEQALSEDEVEINRTKIIDAFSFERIQYALNQFFAKE